MNSTNNAADTPRNATYSDGRKSSKQIYPGIKFLNTIRNIVALLPRGRTPDWNSPKPQDHVPRIGWRR